MEIINKKKGVKFSEKEKSQSNNELVSNYDKRINDLLHKIEFLDFTPQQAYKILMKLQGFLRKRGSLKRRGNVYTPRTETGNYIIDGKVTNLKLK